jgi:hypothetical protein
MSDLQDLIHLNARKAYNEGYERGMRTEHLSWKERLERIQTWTPEKSDTFWEGALWSEQRIIELIRDIFNGIDYDGYDWSSTVEADEVIQVIMENNIQEFLKNNSQLPNDSYDGQKEV